MIRSLTCLWTIVCVLSTTVGYANEVAYKTFVQSADDLVETQPAYQAVSLLTADVFGKIEDLLIVDQQLWVLDSDTKTIFQSTLEGHLIGGIHIEEFQEPTGLAIDQEGNLYVADPVAERVFKISPYGHLLKEYPRPQEPLFGKRSLYKPRKISVDVRGNLYIIGEGATNGIIQLNQSGAFVGYLGANPTERSFLTQLQDTLVPEHFLSGRLSNVPPALTNINMDAHGIVYTVSSVLPTGNIRKLNIAGINMLPSNMLFPDRPLAIQTGSLGNIYVLTAGGVINEYASTGDLLFRMGGSAANTQRLGIYQTPTAIAVDQSNRLYVADAENGIHYLVPSDFAREVHAGLALFEDGRYLDSKKHWEKVLGMNYHFSFGHYALGQALMREEAYSEAMKAFRLSGDKSGYSQAFWEIRQAWITDNFASCLLLLVLAFAVIKFWRWFKKKYVGIKYSQIIHVKRMKNETNRLYTILRHPFDAFYEIKKGQASLSFAIWLLIGLTLIFGLYLYGTGHIFRPVWGVQYAVSLVLPIFVAVILLLIIVHYLVATITDCQGPLRTVFIGSMTALSPVLLGGIPLILLSHLLTINEAFLFHYTMIILIGWSVILLLLMVKEVHHFTASEVVKNSILTIFSFFMVVIVGYIVFVLANQMRHFISDILLEVMTRV